MQALRGMVRNIVMAAMVLISVQGGGDEGDEGNGPGDGTRQTARQQPLSAT